MRISTSRRLSIYSLYTHTRVYIYIYIKGSRNRVLRNQLTLSWCAFASNGFSNFTITRARDEKVEEPIYALRYITTTSTTVGILYNIENNVQRFICTTLISPQSGPSGCRMSGRINYFNTPLATARITV